ncbi:hypothetical protein RJ639_014102 [Escallonia herrerae]|uniref:Uncharacterized protein n=1 Tax=Escallonia herrerae TaxID=1293975 RepID=A0AA88VEZ7_9ASTE|nr:hypothetical protein RJ639_014102 [Escallonia herrerae]
MRQNITALLIGLIGATITLSAYSQSLVSPTQCITVGLLVLLFGLLVREDNMAHKSTELKDHSSLAVKTVSPGGNGPDYRRSLST